MRKNFRINGKPATVDEAIAALPKSFTQKVSNDLMVELANKLANEMSFKDFIMYRGAFFSMICELLAYRNDDERTEDK